MSPTGPMAWEVHTAEKPCPACRYTVKGNEVQAQRLYCEPPTGCGHYHRGPCPEIQTSKPTEPAA